jgi:tetratricopeptide (TPR) repeat protein
VGKTPDDIRKKQQEFTKSFGRYLALIVLGLFMLTVLINAILLGAGRWRSLEFYRENLGYIAGGSVFALFIYLITRQTKTPDSQPLSQYKSSGWVWRVVFVYSFSLLSLLVIIGFTLQESAKQYLLLAALFAIPITLIWLFLLNLSKNKQSSFGLLVRHLPWIFVIVLVVFGWIQILLPVMITGKPLMNAWLALFNTFVSLSLIFTFVVPKIMVDLKHYDAAIQHVNLWLRIRPNSANLYLQRGFYNVSKQDYRAATKDSEQAYKLAQNNSLILANIALLLIHCGEYESALEYAEKGLQTNPMPTPNIEIILHTRKAHIYLHLGDYDNANISCKEALKVEVESYVQSTVFFDTYIQWGITFLLMGDYERALNEFEKARAINVVSSVPVYGLAAAHYKLDNWEKAAEFWQYIKTVDNPDFDKLRESRTGIPAYTDMLEAIDKRYLSSSNNEH